MLDKSKREEIPSFDKMIKPVLMALESLGGSGDVATIDKKVIQIMGITDDVYTIPHGNTNGSEVSYRCAWARTYLKKYGLIDNVKRGLWILTDNYDGNIENIDESKITQEVHKQSLVNFNNAEISNLETNMAFEKYALSVLSEYALQQNKRILTYSNSSDFNYDAILPEGIEDIQDKTYVIFKYSKSNQNYYLREMERELNKLSDLSKKVHLLFILGVVLSDKVKENILKKLMKSTNMNVSIWDYNDLVERSNLDSKYLEYLENPKKAIVDDAISNQQNKQEREKNKNYLVEMLCSAYKNEKVVLFLGAGVSIDAGIPLWADLINKLLIQMIAKKSKSKIMSNKDIKMLNQLASSNKEDSPLTQVRYIRTGFDKTEYYSLVHKVLYENQQTLNTNLLNAITNICMPKRNHIGVRSVVTYNFDNILERKLKQKGIDYNVVYREADISDYESLNVYHVHGYLPNNLDELDEEMNLIFSEEDYHRVYRDSYCWSNIIQLNAFRDNTCLFIGCSLNDPNLRRLLDVAARSGESARHFAILKRNQINPGNNEVEKNLLDIYENIDLNIRESYYKSIGLNIIWVDSFEEIVTIINRLRR